MALGYFGVIHEYELIPVNSDIWIIKIPVGYQRKTKKPVLSLKLSRNPLMKGLENRHIRGIDSS